MMGVIGNADATVVGVVAGFEVSGEKRFGRGLGEVKYFVRWRNRRILQAKEGERMRAS
jgi:hypothetical protein